MLIYQDSLARNLCLLVQTNATVKGITQYNECSKYFVEYALEGMREFINGTVFDSNLADRMAPDIDLITVFLDISGSGFAKDKAIILAKVHEQIIFDVVTTSNYLSSHEILAQIKEKIKLSEKAKIVFVTDGEVCFVDSIRHFFPEAIHIRQFHSRSCKGIIYIHLVHEGQEYTIRSLWDAVLDEGTASKSTCKQRERKAEYRLRKKETKTSICYSELSKECIIWKGTVYAPKGIRRILRAKLTHNKKNVATQHENTSTSDLSVPIIFRGTLEEAKKDNIFAYCYDILKKIFGGLYITSNIVENVFNFKSKLYPHRTIKFGDRILLCILYSHFKLKDKTKEELIGFFKQKVITYDFIMNKVLYGSGLQKNRKSPPAFMTIIQQAIDSGKKLVIHYCDAYHKHTSRIITPKNIITSEYDKTVRLESFCHLRRQDRTFYLERIRDAAIYDPRPTIL